MGRKGVGEAVVVIVPKGAGSSNQCWVGDVSVPRCDSGVSSGVRKLNGGAPKLKG
jgi:hypothetical protein